MNEKDAALTLIVHFLVRNLNNTFDQVGDVIYIESNSGAVKRQGRWGKVEYHAEIPT